MITEIEFGTCPFCFSFGFLFDGLCSSCHEEAEIELASALAQPPEPVCETCGYPLTHFVDESGRGPQGFGCAICDFGPDVYSAPESEYDRAKRHYDGCLEHLRAISHDFTPEGQRAFLKALDESKRAYTDLFWADRDRVVSEVDQLKGGAS